MTVNEIKTEIYSNIKFPETQINYFHDFHKEFQFSTDIQSTFYAAFRY